MNRNLSFFTTGYNYLIQIIPVLIVAPMFFRGEIEFGVVTQSAMVFATLLGAFSLIVTQFQSISSFAAVIVRLSELAFSIERFTQPWVTLAEPWAAADTGLAWMNSPLLLMRTAHFSWPSNLLAVLGLPMFSYLLLRSQLSHKRGTVQWKGRSYAPGGNSDSGSLAAAQPCALDSAGGINQVRSPR